MGAERAVHMRWRRAAFVGVAGVLAQGAQARQLYSSGPISTGALAGNGVFAPTGAAWSELARDCQDPTTANSVLGFGCRTSLNIRLADDFVIPAGQSWGIESVAVLAYQTGSTTTPTITAASLQIWNGVPGQPGSEVVFGDLSTNRLQSVSFASLYRIPSTITPQTCGGVPFGTATNRPLMNVVITVNASLPAGHYWLDWSLEGALLSGPWCPTTTLAPCGRQADPNAGAMQFSGGSWLPLRDPGMGCNPTEVPQTLAFAINGPPGCYANCDASTAVPFLNINDFICFQSRFAAGETAANCDGSTLAPVLNINDFICFQSRFAAGCSAP
jgi:hypothetical protein